MKKTIAILFLLFANIILLAHSVVPHHAHNQIEVCVLNCFCGEAVNDDNCHSQHSDTKGIPDDCLLNQKYLRLDKERQSDCSCGIEHDLLQTYLVLFYIDNTINIPVSEDRPDTGQAYLISYHTQYITQSKGLRAPPFC